jgi:hypothetical protein
LVSRGGSISSVCIRETDLLAAAAATAVGPSIFLLNRLSREKRKETHRERRERKKKERKI